MTERVLDISESGAALSVRTGNVVIECEDRVPVMIPISELAVLVVSHPQVRYSQAVLAGIATQGGSFVVCDEKHSPVGMLLPLNAHSLQSERFAIQAEASLPAKKRSWRNIVRAKIRAQGRVLQEKTGTDLGFPRIAMRVRSGDPSNIEAQASRLYWPALLGQDFRRNRDAPDVNAHLNYGYAVLRAATARALCAAGLHPSLGVHHHNRFNPFCLADDLMEPYRPLVDQVVHGIAEERGLNAPLDRDSRRKLLEVLGGRFTSGEESRRLFDWLSIAASSLRAVLMDGSRDLNLPEI